MSIDDEVAVDNRWGRLHIERTKGFPRRYEVSAATRARQKGQILAYVKCPSFNPFNSAHYYTDAACTQLLFSVRGRWPFLTKNTYQVRTPDKQVIAEFDKDLGKSFANAVIHLETINGIEGIGRDVNTTVNKARRFVNFSALVEFPFYTGGAREIATVSKGWGKIDPFLVNIPRLPNGRQLDWRVAAALAVFMDLALNRAQF
ncbi:MAG: hypothetical protein LBC29_00885 [Propionibacteriaceae bacterium]|nr:hypothetical protein [Propionibacteriaceae bacterium]